MVVLAFLSILTPPQYLPQPTVAQLPSLTASPNPTATVTPSSTPSPTATATATPIPTVTPSPTATPLPPKMADFWDGQATWIMDRADVGLPHGESDTLNWNDTELWSFLHASDRSAGVIDQCGNPAPFPGCVTLWTSTDSGYNFDLIAPICLIPCASCPCDEETDHVQQQQYPRLARADDGTLYMVYEWGARTMLRISQDNGLTWTAAAHIPGTGMWPLTYRSCSTLARIDPHPFVPPFEWDCLHGAPPGIYVEGDDLYIFVDTGSNPGHMTCLKGNRHAGAAGLQPCTTTPLFSGANVYGPTHLNGAAANAFFDFRYVSSADVIREDNTYYMVYEGVRGPGPDDPGDTQFGLGMARSSVPMIDAPWQKHPANPILRDLPGDIGIGHADLIQINNVWYLYTTTSPGVRGRYRLAWPESY